MLAKKVGSLERVDEVWKIFTDKDYYNANFALEGLTVVKVLRDKMPQNNLVSCSDTQFERLTLIFGSQAQPDLEKRLFVKSRKLQQGRSLAKSDNSGLMAYECAHYRFWNDAKLPAPNCYAGLSDNSFGAILLDNEGEFNLAHHILAIRQVIDKKRAIIQASKQCSLKLDIISSEIDSLEGQLEGLVLAAIDTIVEFAVRGSSFFYQLPLKARPPIYTKDCDYFIRRACNYINEVLKDKKDEGGIETTFHLLETLKESLFKPLTKPSDKVYVQGDEFPHNMVGAIEKGKIKVRMIDAASSRFAGMPYSMVKFLFNPIIGLSYPKIVETFEYGYKNLKIGSLGFDYRYYFKGGGGGGFGSYTMDNSWCDLFFYYDDCCGSGLQSC